MRSPPSADLLRHAVQGSSTPLDDTRLDWQPPTEVPFAEGSGGVADRLFSQVATGHSFACGTFASNASAACFGHLPGGAAVWSGPPAASDAAITPALVGADLAWASLAADGQQVVGVLANGSLAQFWSPWADEPHPYCARGAGAAAGAPCCLSCCGSCRRLPPPLATHRPPHTPARLPALQAARTTSAAAATTTGPATSPARGGAGGLMET